MPCYNEEESLPYSVPQLLRAFERAGYRLQLVTVNNGSRDRTGKSSWATRATPEITL